MKVEVSTWNFGFDTIIKCNIHFINETSELWDDTNTGGHYNILMCLKLKPRPTLTHKNYKPINS